MATPTLYPQNYSSCLLADQLTESKADPALVHLVKLHGATHVTYQYDPPQWILQTDKGIEVFTPKYLAEVGKELKASGSWGGDLSVTGAIWYKPIITGLHPPDPEQVGTSWTKIGSGQFEVTIQPQPSKWFKGFSASEQLTSTSEKLIELGKGAQALGGLVDEIQQFTAAKANGKTTAAQQAKPDPASEQPAPAAAQIGLFKVDKFGHALAYPGGHRIPERSRELTAEIAAVAKWVAPGVVGRGRTRMSRETKKRWLTAWHNGELRTCYSIEADHAKPSARHPGAPGQEPTHYLTWQPAVAGEIPAGEAVFGDWTSPKVPKTGAEIDNYLIAACMAHPRHLGTLQRSRWVRAHQMGDKVTVDALSCRARQDAVWGGSYRSSQPVDSGDLPAQPSATDCILNELPVERWPITALHCYADKAKLPKPPRWGALVAVVSEHHDKAAAEAAKLAATPVFTLAPDQPNLGGYHRKLLLVDQHGNQWLFKPAPDTAHRFRPETEHHAHVLARAWGYPTAESRLGEFDGMYGQFQRLLPVKHNLAGYTGADFAALTRDQLCAIAREHVLDWAIDNDDTHGENIIVLDDGAIVGIDKGRAWRYFGGWDGLSGDSSANSNAPLVYTALYAAIAAGHLARDTVDDMYRHVIAQASRMQRLPDARLAQIVGEAVANRPHYRPSTYQRAVPGTPTNAQELIAAATARKYQLVADMSELWARIYSRAGWTPPDITGPLGTNPQGYPLHSGLFSPELHHAVAITKSYGTPAFVAGRDIEDAHILLWRERRPDGGLNIRGSAKVRGQAYKRLRDWCIQRAGDDTPPAPVTLPNEPEYYAAVISYAKTVSFHAEDKQYNPEKLERAQWARRSMTSTLAAAAGALIDPDSQQAATVQMCRTYLGYLERIDQHRDAGTRSQHGDFPRHTYTSTQAKPDPVKVVRCPATRAAVHANNSIKLAPDGELHLGTGVLQSTYEDSYGQPGKMYLLTLPGGEQIEFRGGHDTDTPFGLRGLLQFTIPDAHQFDTSLHAIVDQLATMGLTITGADLIDLELFYWRHLAGIMRNRVDAKPHGIGPSKYAEFWSRVTLTNNATGEAEVAGWRYAFAALTSPEQIESFLAADGYLPRLMHLDTRNPKQPCGRPYWERFDVTREQWSSRRLPALSYKSGPRWAVEAGACMSTEERIRAMAIWKAGQSSLEDMDYGSSSFVFTRQNLDAGYHGINVYFNPRVLIRTSNYAFGCDRFGRSEERCNDAHFEFASMTSYSDTGNELMIKNCLSLLDDIEILCFPSTEHLNRAIALLAERGITEIRGLPVTTRFVHRDDPQARAAAISAVKQSLACPS